MGPSQEDDMGLGRSGLPLKRHFEAVAQRVKAARLAGVEVGVPPSPLNREGVRWAHVELPGRGGRLPLAVHFGYESIDGRPEWTHLLIEPFRGGGDTPDPLSATRLRIPFYTLWTEITKSLPRDADSKAAEPTGKMSVTQAARQPDSDSRQRELAEVLDVYRAAVQAGRRDTTKALAEWALSRTPPGEKPLSRRTLQRMRLEAEAAGTATRPPGTTAASMWPKWRDERAREYVRMKKWQLLRLKAGVSGLPAVLADSELRPGEVALLLDVTTTTIRNLAEAGELKTLRKTRGGHRRYHIDDVLALQARRAPAGSAVRRQWDDLWESLGETPPA